MRSEPSFDLLYIDECEVHLHPTLSKVWTMRGVRPIVPAAGVNRRLCCYGALNYRSGQVHYMTHPKKNAQQFREFLRQLLEANSERRVVLVVDNASYHRTRAVLSLLEDHADHVFVIWLPRYSPELNLIEGLWGLHQAFGAEQLLLRRHRHPGTRDARRVQRVAAAPRHRIVAGVPDRYELTQDRLERRAFSCSAVA